MFKAEKPKKNKPAGCTDAHGTDGYVSKSSPLIAFRGALDMSAAWPYLLGGLVGGLIGGKLFVKVPAAWLRRIFAVFLLYGGVRYLL